MALLQSHTTLQVMGLSSIFTPHASAHPLPPPCLYFPHSLLKTHEENSLFSTTTTIKSRPFSVSTQPRRLLGWPLQGKHVREDYLVEKLSAKEIEELVRGERTVPLVIDFYATWCGPCILMAQELEMLAVEYEDNLKIIKVDTDDEYEFARDMQVRGLPTLYFISPDPNKDAIRAEGLIPLQMMRDIINNQM